MMSLICLRTELTELATQIMRERERDTVGGKSCPEHAGEGRTRTLNRRRETKGGGEYLPSFPGVEKQSRQKREFERFIPREKRKKGKGK